MPAMLGWFRHAGRVLFARRQKGRAGHALYFAILAQARQPAFYESYGVADTLDGRFDMVILLAALVFRRLRALGPAALPLADATFEVMTADLDRSVRELGAGDLGVARRVKAMARGFYGRAEAYERALAAKASLPSALRRNLYGTAAVDDATLDRMASYVQAAAAALDGQGLAALAAGMPAFPPVAEG